VNIEEQLDSAEFAALLGFLRSKSAELERPGAWPGEQFARLAEAGVSGWCIPREFGGSDVGNEILMAGYERLTRACLVTTFILTQQNSACQRLAAGPDSELKRELLARVAGGEAFLTVGISHLSTSRQHLKKPAVGVRQSDRGYVLEGTVPWVTGAVHADSIVTGGTLEDGRQVLLAVPTAAEGVTVEEPVRMLALNASQTGPVKLEGVEVDREALVAGPVEGVMKQGSGGTGSLTTSALAIGAAAGSLERLEAEAAVREDLQEIAAPLRQEWEALHGDLLEASRGEASSELTPESVRRRANSLVVRAAQAYLGAAKGAGFIEGHPAGRAVRESMFFLVWSCPQSVIAAALREFACALR
jgi:alkylation response protein AidB-like acyl-CoA dehydrogenase